MAVSARRLAVVVVTLAAVLVGTLVIALLTTRTGSWEPVVLPSASAL